jgi:hypothetical protein
VLRRIFGLKGDKETGEGRRLHNEELNCMCSALNCIRVTKSRMRWPEHVARRGQERCLQGFGEEN